MDDSDLYLLTGLAAKYVWWKPPAEAILMPERVIAQVMNIGDCSDVEAMAEQLGQRQLQAVLEEAQAGQFSPRSWVYWHYRLGMADFGQVPDLPRRTFA